VRRVPPPSQPPPAGGRRRVPAPSGGGSGKGLSLCPRSYGAGVPPALPGRVHWAGCATRMTVSREHKLLEQGCGETGFPHPSARGRVWEGAALPRTTFSLRRCAARAAWTANVKIGSRRGEWGNRVSPYLSGRGPEARAPRPRPLGGFGRAQPSQEQHFHCGVVRREPHGRLE